jgi:hypothetical protein
MRERENERKRVSVHKKEDRGKEDRGKEGKRDRERNRETERETERAQ